MKLVLVHGRAQQHKDPAALEESWRDALVYGLARAGTELAPGTTFGFPYYGDILDDLATRDLHLIAAAATSETSHGSAGQFEAEILAEFAANLGLSERDIDREMEGDVAEVRPSDWRLIRAIARAIDRVPGLNGAAIEALTRDVYVYLSDIEVRRTIDRVVADSLPNEPFVLIAHSLGSIVTYNVLSQHALTPSCVRLVTVGSPLGLRAIKTRLANPLKSPACLEDWFNAYDSRDIVALNPLDGANFAIVPPVTNMGDVVNFTDNRHGIEGYLADPSVARKIADATHGR